MPSKLDAHTAMIEGWLAAQPQLTALAIVSRLSEKYSEEFGTRQHSIVLKVLGRKAAEQLVAQEPLGDATTAVPLPGVVDGSGYVGPDPPTAHSSSKPGKPPGAAECMTLATDEFIRRFLIHVLPKGLHRIRHYGLFAKNTCADNIVRARELLAAAKPEAAPTSTAADSGKPSCPCCGGRMIIIEVFERGATPRHQPTAPTNRIRVDTS